MIHLSTMPVGVESGQRFPIQSQSRGRNLGTDEAPSQGFPPLAGFGTGNEGKAEDRGPTAAGLSGRGFGNGALHGSDGQLPNSDTALTAAGKQMQTPPLREDDVVAELVVAGTELPWGHEALIRPEVDAALEEGNSSSRFAGTALAMSPWVPSSSAGYGSDGLRWIQLAAHAQDLSPSRSQGTSPNQNPAQTSSQALSSTTSQAFSKLGVQELSRALAPLIGHGGAQTVSRGTADAVVLGGQNESPLLAAGGVRSGAGAIPEWSPVRVDPHQAHWGRELMAALAERVEMQISQQIRQARIRLDPPELGRLQLTVRMDGERLSVQFHASHAQVRDALLHQQDRLRADLAGEYGQGVEVSVGQEPGQQHSQTGDRPWDGLEEGVESGWAAMENPEGSATDRTLPSRSDRGWVSTLV